MPNHTSRRTSATPLLPAVLVIGLIGATAPAWGQGCDPIEVVKVYAGGGGTNDELGNPVAISGDVVVVGAEHDDELGVNAGSASVYRFDGMQWVHEAKLLASDGGAGDGFGYSLAASGDRILVGAPSDRVGGAQFAGSAYLFRFDGSQWVEEAKLIEPFGAAMNFFGRSTALSDDVLVVGTAADDPQPPFYWRYGSAHVFRHGIDTGWVWEADLFPSDHQNDQVEFAWSVAVSGDQVMVGAPWEQTSEYSGGAAYAYRFDGSVWTETAKLRPSGNYGDGMGRSVALSGTVAVFGAESASVNGAAGAGAAYVFRWSIDSGWIEEAKLTASDAGTFQHLGSSVAISGDTAIIGDQFDDTDSGSESGSVYVFRFDGTQWSEESKMLASDGESGDAFGHAVGVSEDQVVVGAPYDDDLGTQAGAAYIFDLGCENSCPPDLNGDGAVDTRDFIAFLNAWATSDPLADWNDDGTINTQDFIAYLNDWAAGC